MVVSRKMDLLENINPKLYRKCEEREITPEEEDDNVVDPFDSREVFGILLLHCLFFFFNWNNLPFVRKMFSVTLNLQNFCR